MTERPGTLIGAGGVSVAGGDTASRPRLGPGSGPGCCELKSPLSSPGRGTGLPAAFRGDDGEAGQGGSPQATLPSKERSTETKAATVRDPGDGGAGNAGGKELGVGWGLDAGPTQGTGGLGRAGRRGTRSERRVGAGSGAGGPPAELRLSRSLEQGAVSPGQRSGVSSYIQLRRLPSDYLATQGPPRQAVQGQTGALTRRQRGLELRVGCAWAQIGSTACRLWPRGADETTRLLWACLLLSELKTMMLPWTTMRFK